MSQLSLFAEEDRLKHLSEMGDSLEKLKDIDWEMFRSPLQKSSSKEGERWASCAVQLHLDVQNPCASAAFQPFG